MIKNNLKFIFFGTPEVASKTLEDLKQAGYFPSLIVTSIDKPQGRKMIMTPPPVKTWALQNNIPFLQPEKIDEELIDKIQKLNFDFSIVVAYGKMLPEKLISTPKHGTLNIHYSLLPKYRGASPVESALLNGDSITGVSIQKMAYKLDSGPIIASREVEIYPEEKKEELRDRLIGIGSKLLIDVLPDYLENKLNITPQNENEATFCHKIRKEDGEIKTDGNDLENYNKYRAYFGWPGIFFFKEINGNKTRFKITKARYENDKFIIEKVIPEGKKEIAYK
jgi:methionyl-tRNA formyltransferase